MRTLTTSEIENIFGGIVPEYSGYGEFEDFAFTTKLGLEYGYMHWDKMTLDSNNSGEGEKWFDKASGWLSTAFGIFTDKITGSAWKGLAASIGLELTIEFLKHATKSAIFYFEHGPGGDSTQDMIRRAIEVSGNGA